MTSLPLVLASESPRRKQLLEEAGIEFTVYPVKVSEILQKNLNAEAQILQISERKWAAARRAWNQAHPGLKALLLTADTMVVFEHQALGKPESPADAVATLEKLSGNVHFVITAISLGPTDQEAPASASSSTEVWFYPILRQEILDYVSTQEPMDKAGSYAIQGGAKKFVQKFVGAYDNVVGLPVATVVELAEKNHWTIPRVERTRPR